jgi:hypothetical protein
MQHPAKDRGGTPLPQNAGAADKKDALVYFFRRGSASLTAETRLNPEGPGYQLVVTEDSQAHVETFETLQRLLAREHELLQAWRAQGWSEVGASAGSAGSWRGPR